MGITEERIAAGRSPNGGWTRAQLAQWGVPWPPPKGWRRKLVQGSLQPPNQYASEKIQFGKSAKDFEFMPLARFYFNRPGGRRNHA